MYKKYLEKRAHTCFYNPVFSKKNKKEEEEAKKKTPLR